MRRGQSTFLAGMGFSQTPVLNSFTHPLRLRFYVRWNLDLEMQVTEMLSHISHAFLVLLITESVECYNVAAKREHLYELNILHKAQLINSCSSNHVAQLDYSNCDSQMVGRK